MKYKYVRMFEDEAKIRSAPMWQAHPESAPQVFAGFNGTGRHVLKVLLGREEWTETDHRWHLSISADNRVPTWDEIVDAVHQLRPGVPFVFGVPPRSWWMNVHPHVIHVWETKDDALVAQWRTERMGHQPT